MTTTKNQLISATILALVNNGVSLKVAFNAVLGEGAYENLVSETYDALRAAALGAKAFADGKKRVPFLDADFMRFLRENHSNNVLPFISAWRAAWDKANLAAPIV